MDTQAIQLEDKYLKDYKELYSLLVETFVLLHNSNQIFIKNLGRDSGLKTNRHLTKIKDICRQMVMLGRLASKEATNNRRKEGKLHQFKKEKKESSHKQVANNSKRNDNWQKEFKKYNENLRNELLSKQNKPVKKLLGSEKTPINKSDNKNDLDI